MLYWKFKPGQMHEVVKDSFNNYFLSISYESALALGASNMEGYEPIPKS